MTLEHVGEVTRSPSEPGGAGPSPAGPTPSERKAPVRVDEPKALAPDSRLAVAQRKAAAAKEAAARIRANASQYRIEPKPTAQPSRAAPVAAVPPDVTEPPTPAPPPPATQATSSAAPADPETIETANGVEVAVPPPPRVRPKFPPKPEARADTETSPQATATSTPFADKKATTSFRPMRRPGTEPPTYQTAYGFRSAMGARSAGRLLIGEAQPIRPSRARRAIDHPVHEAPRRDARGLPQQDEAPGPQNERPAASNDPSSRFNRLSQDIAERQAWLGVDPETMRNGGPAPGAAATSPWGRLTSWLFGSERNTTD